VENRCYRDLKVWQAAMELATDLYRITESFPTYERFLLTTELRRAGITIVSSIAEGHSLAPRHDRMKHISVARGSAIEVEVQLLIAERLGYLEPEVLAVARARCDAVSRLLDQLKPTAGAGRRRAGRAA
jgi:four helix bundle protein